MTIYIFEDKEYSRLYPLTYLRPVFDLRCGILTLKEKIQLAYPKAKIKVLCRKDFSEDQISEEGLFINGRILANKNLAKLLPLRGPDELFFCEDELVAVRTSKPPKGLNELFSLSLPRKNVEVKIIRYAWDLIKLNHLALEEDFSALFKRPKNQGKTHGSAIFYQKENIQIDKGAEVEALCVLDARSGPIYIASGAKVTSLSKIEGPAYIGKNSLILKAHLRQNTSIGPSCKVGGEVEDSIFLGFSNKQHEGYVGHSYICEWVNLGALTTTSDLKNNYSHIKVWVNGEMIDSKEQFMGSVISDHSKTAIGSMLNTGTVMGIFVNYFSPELSPKYLPSFTWGTKEKYELEKALETAEKMMKRRNASLTSSHKSIIKAIYR